MKKIFLIILSCLILIGGNLQGQSLKRIAPRVDKDVTKITGTTVRVVFNRSTKSARKDPDAVVYQDVYKDGVLIIKAGTPVDFFVGQCKRSTPKTLGFRGFEVISTNGNSIKLNGEFVFSTPLHSHYVSKKQSEYLSVFQRINYGNMHLFRLSSSERNAVLDTLLTYYRLHVWDFPPMKSLEVLREVVRGG